MSAQNTFRQIVKAHGTHMELDLPPTFANRRLAVLITAEEDEGSFSDSLPTTGNIVKQLRGRGKQYKIDQTTNAVDNLVAERARDEE